MNEGYTYERTWEEIEDMLDKAERKQHHHSIKTGDTTLSKRIGWLTLEHSKD